MTVTPNGTRSEQRGERATETEAEAEKRSTSVTSDQQTPGAGTTTARIRGISQADALTRLITDLRPDWRPDDVRAWALTDDRPWSVVVTTGITRCTDRDVRLPAGLRHIGPVATHAAPRIPTIAEYRRAKRCDHGEIEGQCALCRRHLHARQEHA